MGRISALIQNGMIGKSSTDHGCSDSVYIKVYLWKENIVGNESIMTVEYNAIGE